MPNPKEGKGKKGKKKGKVAVRVEEDPLSASAMEKAYYMCANAADFLAKRDLPWPLAKSKAAKKKKKK